MPKKGTGVSTRRHQVQTRLRRGNTDAKSEIQLLGYPPIDTWTLAELCAGKPKGWKGPGGQWLKPLVKDEIRQRVRAGTFDKIRELTPEAIKALKELLSDESSQVKLSALKLVLEYVIGAPERRVAIRESTAGEMLLADIIVFDDGDEMYTGRMIDGEVVEDEDDDLPQ